MIFSEFIVNYNQLGELDIILRINKEIPGPNYFKKNILWEQL